MAATGDCCPSTCKTNPALPASCSVSQLNCRDPAGNKDVVPPTLVGVPEASTMFLNHSRFFRNFLKEPLDVSAYDNYPCFNGRVTQVDRNVTNQPRDCASGK
jgi:hypothetical protein